MPKIVKNNTVYASVPSSASGIAYNGTTSGISANTVQGAIDEVVEEKADRVPEPVEYDSTATYNVGDFCTHDNNIYLCSNKITTPEVWTSNHWTLCNAQQDYLHSLNPVGNGSFSLNRKNGTTIGELSFAGGANVTASGYTSHAEGNNTVASGSYSHAEGFVTTASGTCSHAEGYNTTASSSYSHTEGYSTTASGNYSHAEGYSTTASGQSAHAEGTGTLASVRYSHAEGLNTSASGQSAHAEGQNTFANHRSQHVFGEYNVADTSSATVNDRGNYAEIVGNGTADNARSNARTLDWSGNEVLAGTLTASGLILTSSITDAVLTSPRCEIASIQNSKCTQIGNIIFYSAEFTLGSTIQQAGAIYFFLNKIVQADYAWGTLFYDTGDLIYKVCKGTAAGLWVTNGTTRTQCSDLAGKSKLFLNITVIKA